MTTTTTPRAMWARLDAYTWVRPGWSLMYRSGRAVIPGWYLAREDGTDLRRVRAYLDEEPAALRLADRDIARAEATAEEAAR